MITIADLKPSDIKYFWKNEEKITSYRRVSGLYIIKCVAKESSMYGELYVGQAYDLYERLRGHFKDLRLQKHNNIILTRIFEKYLLDAFEFSILKTLTADFRNNKTSLELEPVLTVMEQCYLTAFDTKMNIAKVANSPLGITRSVETRAKLRAKKLGIKMSDKARKNMSDSGGEPFSLYHKEKGTVVGKNLFLYANTNGYNHSALYKVKNGNSYTHKGWYQSESAFLDKDQWLADNPIPTSKYPCVSWDRYAGLWKAALRFNDAPLKIGYFKDEYEAHIAVVNFCKTHGLKDKQIPFEMYHPIHGVVSGDDLYDFGRQIGVKGSIFTKLLDERSYTVNGYYKSEEYYLDKQKWLDNNPIPTSRYPGVFWHRVHKRWATAGVRYNGKLHQVKGKRSFQTEEDAFIAQTKLLESLGLNSYSQLA